MSAAGAIGSNRYTLVTGVIGADTHIVGNRILSMALEEAGSRVVSLGALTPAGDFIRAAVETAADAILVSSLYGQGELDCRGFRELCVGAGRALLVRRLSGAARRSGSLGHLVCIRLVRAAAGARDLGHAVHGAH
ncbi:MAG: cobalamin-dependent protein, partial [Burkholderiales bacterium]